MEVVSGSGKWKYCEVVVDGPNEPPYTHFSCWNAETTDFDDCTLNNV